MIRLNTNIQLDNGAIVNHYIVAIVSISTKAINLVLDGFASKELATTALERPALSREQDTLVGQLNELLQKEELTEEEKIEANSIQDRISELADEINATKDYSTYVIECDTIQIPYINEVTKEYIFQEIIKLNKYKDATLYSE